MRVVRSMLIALIPAVALGACTTLSDQDRATLAAASQNAQQAKDTAQEALNTARAAQASAANAVATASQAASDARAANEKADRMFQRSLRKTSP